MPHYGVNTQLNEKQMAKLRAAIEKKSQTKYKFIRDAILAHCEETLKEKKQVEREENGSRTETGRQEPLKISY